jgi:putative ABC transport system permease protein
VNETFARQVFANEPTVGKRIISLARQIGPLGRNLMYPTAQGHTPPVPFTIVGVVADVHQSPIGQADEPVIYHAQRQFPFRALTVAARGTDKVAVVSAMRTALRSLDPAIPLSNIKTMEERIVTATAAPRLLTAVLTTFAVLTGLLAAIGVYGLLAWTVNERRRELAIRLALGAQPRSLAALVTRHGLLLAISGVVLGLASAQLGGRLLRAVLFQTHTMDLTAATGTAALLIVAAGLACLAPARRAARVTPLDGLRD